MDSSFNLNPPQPKRPHQTVSGMTTVLQERGGLGALCGRLPLYLAGLSGLIVLVLALAAALFLPDLLPTGAMAA
jgi:hypothetical protein